jgi:hypothetical protein
VAGASLLLASGCAFELPGEPPPEKAFYYPIGLAVSPDQTTAYVVSSNFDQRYNAGWVSAVDLRKLVDAIDSVSCAGTCKAGSRCVVGGSGFECVALANASKCGSCQPFEVCADVSGAFQCRQLPDLTAAMGQQLRVPSLGGQIALDPLGRFAVVAARGGRPLTRIELGSTCEQYLGTGCQMHCGDPNAREGLDTPAQKTDCDCGHLTRVVAKEIIEGTPPPAAGAPCSIDSNVVEDVYFQADAASGNVIDEETVNDPFGVSVFYRQAADVDTPYVAVGYLGGGYVSLFRAPVGERLDHTRMVGPFLAGISGVVTYPAATGRTFLAATSRNLRAAEQTGDMAALYDIDVDLTLDAERDRFRVHEIGRFFGGYELRDIAFATDASGAPLTFVANSSPNSITVLDSRLEQITDFDVIKGSSKRLVPRYLALGAFPVSGRPSGLAYVGRGPLPGVLAVTSFDDDSLFLLAVNGPTLELSRRLDRIGQGPFTIRSASVSGRQLLLITAFFDHAVVVVDLTDADPQKWWVAGELRSPTSIPSTDRAR